MFTMATSSVRHAFGLEPKELARRMRRFERSTRFFATEYETLLQRYPNSWVAIIDAEVQAAGKSLEEINARIRDLGLPRSEVLVQYIDASDLILIL
jgi:uncharacterized protein DUF5678